MFSPIRIGEVISMNYPLIETIGLTKVFKIGGLFRGTNLKAVDNVNIIIDSSEPIVLSIVGESGCGKTTLARLLLKIIQPTSGTIRFEGEDITKIKKKTKLIEFKRKVQPIFQNPFESFNPLNTVGRYLYASALKLQIAENKEEARKIINEALIQVGLNPDVTLDKKPHEFSGGELQRICIARALIPKPKLIIADEPVSMLDASIRMSIINLFLKLKKELNTFFIYITHDLATAYYISDFIAIMFRGSIIEYGPAHSVLSDPLHPYTEMLLNSIPDISKKWSGRVLLSGLELKEFEAVRCKFLDRCPYANDKCRSVSPEMIKLKNNRMVLCLRYH
jgi:peptide/nickel transport system ATP-binding protein